jgi:hypothetical protein
MPYYYHPEALLAHGLWVNQQETPCPTVDVLLPSNTPMQQYYSATPDLQDHNHPGQKIKSKKTI